MNPIIVINKFAEVVFQIGKKPIVICDIDKTLIHSEKEYSHYYNELFKDYQQMYAGCYKGLKCHQEIDATAKELVASSIHFGYVKQTDEQGFSQMVSKIKSLNGKIILLTARGEIAHEKTMNDLKKSNVINPEQFEIHYTNNKISKGNYMRQHHLLDGYDHCVFIDDYAHYLQSALDIFPHIQCYLFQYKDETVINSDTFA